MKKSSKNCSDCIEFVQYDVSDICEECDMPRWDVKIKYENERSIGDIYWDDIFKEFVFEPWIEQKDGYKSSYLREIAEFCEIKTKEHKGAK